MTIQNLFCLFCLFCLLFCLLQDGDGCKIVEMMYFSSLVALVGEHFGLHLQSVVIVVVVVVRVQLTRSLFQPCQGGCWRTRQFVSSLPANVQYENRQSK